GFARATALAGHRGDVATGAEPASRAGEQHHAHAVVGGQSAQRLAQREHVLQVECVELLRPVQRDGDDRVATFDVDAQALAASTRAKICSGPSGVLVLFTPSGRNASSTALATAACAPIAPPSPMPL